MHILFLSQLLPYPTDAGAKVRLYYTLRWLAQHHAVTLVTFTRSDDSPASVEHLRSFCTAVHTVPMNRGWLRDVSVLAASITRDRSFIIHRDTLPEMDALLSQLIAETHFDALHADQLWMAQYALRVRPKAPAARLVLDEHNACFQVFERMDQFEPNLLKRWLWRREAEQLQRYEAHVCGQFDHVVTVTEQDGEILQRISRRSEQPATKFTTIPICVDTAEVAPIQPFLGDPNVLHLGTMFWPPNEQGVLWFAAQVWPLVLSQLPAATFSVLGKHPPAAITALADSHLHIDVVGYVADPYPWLQRAGVFIVPLLSGGGMRVKIVDAWRWGLPVVSTSIGAEGIRYRDGENIVIADTPEDFAAAVLRVLTDPALSHQLRQNGRRWIETYYNWRTIYAAWDEIYK